jgi:hypothetical protein
MFVVLLMAGLWIAVNPESVLRALGDLGPALDRFADMLRGLGAPYFCPPRRQAQPQPDSRGARIAMRCFGIAIGALAFAGLAGLGR